jgi:hypothetical protein
MFVNDEPHYRDKSRAYAPERSIALSRDALRVLGDAGDVAEDISLAISRELEELAYLGPLRRKPERDYSWNRTSPGSLSVDGGNVVDVLFAGAQIKSNDPSSENIIEFVSRWLQRMGIADRLEIHQVGRSSRYEIVIHTDGIRANLRDVGIGISLVLPVIAIARFAPPGASIVLEEPEIHLHPLAQALLAELFVEASKERGVQFIVETHSEHMFRRLQTLIARGDADADACSLYFVDRDEAEAHLRKLEVDEFGRLQDWPENFFGDALGEARELARLSFERQRQQSKPRA